MPGLFRGRPARHHAIFFGIAVVAAALLALIVSELGDARATPATSAPPKAALTISVATAEVAPFQELVNAPGPVAAWQEATLGAPLAGLRLVAINADVGAVVHRGQVLAQYDTAGLHAMEAQARANIAQAQAAVVQASLNNQRAAKLRESGMLSEQALLQASTLEDTARAQLASAQATLQANQVQLRDASIVAPDDGVISARNATLGSVGAVGQELFRLIRRGRIEWRAQLTPAQASAVTAGLAVTVAQPDGAASAGRVRMLAPSLDAQSRLLTAYVDLAGSTRLRAGTYATGTIVIGTHSGVAVPATSIVVHDGNSYVFVVRQIGNATTVLRRRVTRGRTQEARIEVLDGLNPGEPVASSGAGFLEDGDIVRIASAAQQAQAH